MFTRMLLHMYQIFSSLQGHLHFSVHFFLTLMVNFFFDHPISYRSNQSHWFNRVHGLLPDPRRIDEKGQSSFSFYEHLALRLGKRNRHSCNGSVQSSGPHISWVMVGWKWETQEGGTEAVGKKVELGERSRSGVWGCQRGTERENGVRS